MGERLPEERPFARPPTWLQISIVLALLALGFSALPRAIAPLARTPRTPHALTAPQLALVDGEHHVSLDPAGRVTGLEAFSRETQERVASALTSRRIMLADLTDVRIERTPVAGATPAAPLLRLEAPVGAVVEETQPTLRWQALAQPSVYRVIVLGADRSPIIESADLTSGEWTPPKPLERGRVYSWQVSAEVAGRRILAPAPPEPEVRFRVLDAVQALVLAGERARGQSHLVRVVLCAQAGLDDEARRELMALRDDNPASPVVESLLESLAR
jgi:hypothetical protein